MPMAADTVHLNDNDGSLVDWQEGKRQKPKTSHDDTDSLVVNLYHHLTETCHIYLRVIDLADRNSNATQERSPWNEYLEAAEQDQHGVQAFGTTGHTLEKSNLAEEPIKNHAEREKRRSKFAEAVARLLLWGDVIHGGKSTTLALVAQGLYHNVVELLHSCGRDLQELRLYLDNNAFSETDLARSLRALDTWLEKTTYMLQDATEYSKDAENLSRAQASGNSIMSLDLRTYHQSEIIESFEESVAMLMDLSPTIEDVLALHVFLDAEDRAAAVDFTVTDAAQLWVPRIAESYKSASDNLVQRLGEANWQRYCKLRAPQDAAIAEEYSQAKFVFHGPTATKTAKTKSATASSIFQDSALGQSICSTTEYAQSNASHSSFVSFSSDSSHHFHRVPPEPDEVASGRSFLCPLCRIEIHGISNRIQWKMHVFHDLQPYLCLADHCSDLLQTFSSRKAWAEHDRTHRESDVFECRNCRYVCPTFAQFENHLSQSHAELTLEQQHGLQSTAARTLIDDILLWSCPLCDANDFSNPRNFRSHVCQHLEDIALATVPPELYPDDDADSVVSDAGWESVSGDQADDTLFVEPKQDPQCPLERVKIRQKFAQLWPEIQKSAVQLGIECPPSLVKGTLAAELWQANARLKYGQALQRGQMASNRKRELEGAAKIRTQHGSPLTLEKETRLEGKIRACIKVIKGCQNFMKDFRVQQERFTKEIVEIAQMQQLQQRPRGTEDLSYPCAFHHFGCAAVFPDKNVWARHAKNQHLQLSYYRCDLDGCNPDSIEPSLRSRPITRTMAKERSKPGAQAQRDGTGAGSNVEEPHKVYNDFNSKDLFTQHCRRMHGPSRNPSLCSNPLRKKNGQLNPTKEDEAAFEQQLVTIRKRCWNIRRHPPARTNCGYCGMVFDKAYFVDDDGDDEVGPPVAARAWESRMDHIARHYEHDATGADNEAIDKDLVEWGLQTGVLRVLPDGRPWLMSLEDPKSLDSV